MPAFDFALRTRVVFGDDVFLRLGDFARELGFARTLVVADAGILATGLVQRAADLLGAAGIAAHGFHRFDGNLDSAMVEAGRAHAASRDIDSIVALGGGSSLDCAKAINVLLSNGGSIRDSGSDRKAARRMLPSLAVVTTAGTGSEARSRVMVCDVESREQIAWGDPGAAFRLALLDPQLTITQPRSVTAIAGYDAIAHAVESFVTTRRSEVSELFARDAWRRLNRCYERVLAVPNDVKARGAMLWGAHQAGIAVEHSALGAAHACARPLAARYGTTHGIAVAVMLPHVVRWNGRLVADQYADLLRAAGRDGGPDPGARLAERLEALARAGELPRTLRDLGARREDFTALAADATTQSSGASNPRPFDADAALTLYEQAY
jgi:alcohol dehydrogenase